MSVSSTSRVATKLPLFRVVCVEGIIGAGKTTLLQKIASSSKVRHRLTVVSEPIEAWKDVRKASCVESIGSSSCSVSSSSSLCSSSISTLKKSETEESSDKVRQFNILEQMYLNPKRWSFSFQMWALTTYSETLTSAVRDLTMIKHSDRDISPKSRILLMERSLFANRVFAKVMCELGSINEMEWSMYDHMFRFVERNTEQIHSVVMLDVDPRVALQRCRLRARDGEECVTEDYMVRLHREYLKILPQMKENHCIDVLHLPDDSTKMDILDTYLSNILSEMDEQLSLTIEDGSS